MKANQEWLDGLNVGDEVAMDIGGYRSRQLAIFTITKITPTRRMTTSNGVVFSADGREYGKKGSHWNIDKKLIPVTDEIREDVERRKLVYTLENVKFKDLELEHLRALKAVLESEGFQKTEEK